MCTWFDGYSSVPKIIFSISISEQSATTTASTLYQLFATTNVAVILLLFWWLDEQEDPGSSKCVCAFGAIAFVCADFCSIKNLPLSVMFIHSTDSYVDHRHQNQILFLVSIVCLCYENFLFWNFTVIFSSNVCWRFHPISLSSIHRFIELFTLDGSLWAADTQTHYPSIQNTWWQQFAALQFELLIRLFQIFRWQWLLFTFQICSILMTTTNKFFWFLFFFQCVCHSSVFHVLIVDNLILPTYICFGKYSNKKFPFFFLIISAHAHTNIVTW